MKSNESALERDKTLEWEFQLMVFLPSCQITVCLSWLRPIMGCETIIMLTATRYITFYWSLNVMKSKVIAANYILLVLAFFDCLQMRRHANVRQLYNAIT